MNPTRLRTLLLVLTLALASPAMGAVGGSIGGFGTTTCRAISDYIVKNWWNLRSHMTNELNVVRPKRKDFQCVSPGFAQDLMPRPVPGHQDVLQCFGRGSDPRICCDRDLRTCVAYSGE